MATDTAIKRHRARATLLALSEYVKTRNDAEDYLGRMRTFSAGPALQLEPPPKTSDLDRAGRPLWNGIGSNSNSPSKRYREADSAAILRKRQHVGRSLFGDNTESSDSEAENEMEAGAENTTAGSHIEIIGDNSEIDAHDDDLNIDMTSSDTEDGN